MTIPTANQKDFMNIWGHLETLARSSSPDLSAWLYMCISGRSQEGYSAMFSPQALLLHSSSFKSRNKIKFGMTITPISVAFSERFFGEGNTIVEAMIADAKMLNTLKLLFNEPILKNDVIKPSE